MTPHQSYVQGCTEIALLQQTIGDYFDDIAERHADNWAVISYAEHKRLTWAELQRQVDQLAIGLLSTGLRKGDYVALWAPNGTDWLRVQLACAKSGLILLSVDPYTTMSVLRAQLNAVSAKALLLPPLSQYIDTLTQLLPELLTPRENWLQTATIPSLRHVIVLDEATDASKTLPEAVTRLSTLNDMGASAESTVLSLFAKDLSPNTPCAVHIKLDDPREPTATTLSHHALLNNAYFAANNLGLSDADKICVSPQQAARSPSLNLAYLSHGSTLLYPDANADIASLLALLQNEQCTYLSLSAEQWQALLHHAQQTQNEVNTHTWRPLISGALPATTPAQTGGHQLITAYGADDSIPFSFSHRPQPTDHKAGLIAGRALPHVEAKIIDEHGLTVPVGQQGQLCLRAYHSTDALSDTSALDHEGWLHTQQQALIDENGCCYLIAS